MTPDDRLRINVALYQRFLGHEGHEFEQGADELICVTCHHGNHNEDDCLLPDLTTDGNAMLALKSALAADGWTVGSEWSFITKHWLAWCEKKHLDLDVERIADTEPKALALAADKLPEDDHAD